MLQVTNRTELFNPIVVTGRELAHQRRLVGPRYRACIAVNLHDNKTPVLPTLTQYRQLLDVNAHYVAIARAMPAEQRTHFLYGKVDISFSAILRERSHRPASLGDNELMQLIDDIGIDRVRGLVCIRDSFSIAAG
jgi:hypothetical protein